MGAKAPAYIDREDHVSNGLDGYVASMRKRAMAGRRVLAGYLRDTSGASAVEFAIVVFPFVFTVLFLFQMALSMYWIQSIEHSTQQAARAIRTGSVQNANLSIDQFKAQTLCPRLVPGMNCDDVTVAVYPIERTWSRRRTSGTYAYFDRTRPSLIPAEINQANARFCPGGPGDMVFVDTVYRAPVFVPSLWLAGATTIINNRPVVLLRATAVVMNEPFATSSAASC